MSDNVPKYIQIRSFLFANVQTILDSMSAKRQASKIEADDLFAMDGEEASDVVNFNYNYPLKAKFDVLSEEKNSLGLYVSGNPLEAYVPILDWAREVSLQDEVHLVLVEKIKKIFTKAGGMMLALQITTPFEEIEGLIFPKIALKYSAVLEENQIYWAFGKIKRKVKKETEETDDSGIKEFDEKPKLLINSVVAFNKGVLSLLEDLEMPMSDTRKDILKSQNWDNLLIDPDGFAVDKLGDSKTENRPVAKVKILRLAKKLGTEKLKDLKSKLKTQPISKGLMVNIELETIDGFKKVKGNFWIENKDMAEFKEFLG